MQAKKVTAFLLFLSFITPSLLAQQYDEELDYRKWRFTLFPPLSTNGVDAPDYTARYSLNFLVGYHGGLDGVELGGLVNYTRLYSNGLQIAGLVNATGGEMNGVHIAGLSNISKENMSGIQVAGLGNISRRNLEGVQGALGFNYSGRSTSGIQAAGLANISRKDIEGLQWSGLVNAAYGDISGLQVSGVANTTHSDVEGLQITGGLNYAGGDVSGLQISGLGNISVRNIEGLMISTGFNYASGSASGLLVTGGINISTEQEGASISGLANIAQEMTGLQFGGLMNASRKSTGLQIGLFNFAREFEGVPVGFISLYGNGRKNFDVRYADGGFTDIGINLGTYRVYNMALFGYNTTLDRDVYRVGLAVGLEKDIKESFPRWKDENWYVNQEIRFLHHFEEEFTRKTNALWSYSFNVGKRFSEGFSVYAGPSYNMQVSRVPGSADYTWYSLWSPDWKGRQYRFWVGFNIGIRLFKQKDLPPLNQSFEDWGDGGWKIDW